ncbi:MAG: M1 family metallopeptidase [Bacteroidetes bacterium]|nr:M1 family metallopeptidase [Bacteroidota bacterium]
MKFLLLSFALAFCMTGLSQNNYWQQEVNYQIEVQLDDVHHELNGFITIDYKNHSPETLSFIYLHLWANAYKNTHTPFAKQLIENGSWEFRRSKPSERGYIDSLNFKINSEACRWLFDSTSEEICKVILNSPLSTGESVRISTPFHIKLPYTFSRMGHVRQSYQISQWYPKPAVYDKDGWHTMPYLDQGEFYGEFGSYNVSITLPENYVVGATGDLQDTAEIRWMNERAEATLKTIETKTLDYSFPASSQKTKTIRFKQDNIHDFAWFADKRYYVLKGDVELPASKHRVETWSLFTQAQSSLWIKAPEYLADAIRYYSNQMGDYPYRQVTAVQGIIGAGGGMEYPNVTIVGPVKNGEELDMVITHEVGHNWFYGMLGSNEREHPWMDEGINSYYENRYAQIKYPEKQLADMFSKPTQKFFDLLPYKSRYARDFAYQLMARENRDEPVEQNAKDYTSFNYGAVVYGKSAMLMEYLEKYLGTEIFDMIMKKYFATWKYKHPEPEDLRRMFETETGKDLSWFFEDLIQTKNKIDYKIASAKKQKGTDSLTILLKNINKVSSPVLLTSLKRDSVISSQWLDGFTRTKVISISKGEADKIQIDPGLIIPEINRRNNTYKINRLAHKFERLRLQFLGSIENQNRTQVFFAPYIGWNNYDKTQVGLAIYSPMVPTRKFSYYLIPAFGTGSKQFIGFGKFSLNLFPDEVQKVSFGLFAQRFSYLLFPENLTFNKIEPSISIEFKKRRSRSPYIHSLQARSVIIISECAEKVLDEKTQRYFVDEIKYRLERRSTLNPFSVQVTFRHGRNFGNLSAEGRFLLSYNRPNEGFKIRLFAGGFLFNTKLSSDISAPNPRFYLSNVSNSTYAYWLQKDYMFDETFLDRNGRDKNLARQVSVVDGGFRSNTNVGATGKFISAINLSSSIHRFVPIHPFLSGALWVNDDNKLQVAAEAGISLIALPEMVEIHLPFLVTNNIRNNQKIIGIHKWYQRITFTLKLELQNPLSFLRKYINL